MNSPVVSRLADASRRFNRKTMLSTESDSTVHAPLARLKNQFRFQVALRAPVDAPLSDLAPAAQALIPPTSAWAFTSIWTPSEWPKPL
jgi:hypothetical protein